MKKLNIYVLSICCLLVIGYFYFIFLPPINLQSPTFYMFFVVVVLTIGIATFIYNNYPIENITTNNILKSKGFISIILVVIFSLIINSIIFSPIFISKQYSERILITNGDFKNDVAPINTDSLPLLDKASTQKIGDRVMGEIPELISQFIVSEEYNQINYNKQLFRVTPLEYADFFKWFINKSEGIPGYIMVNSTTGLAEFINVKGGINYSSSALFFKNITIHLRLSFPTLNLGTSKFEINEDGIPHYITPVYGYKGIGMMEDVTGIVVTNATTGENNHYSIGDIPNWVDNVYPSHLIIEQIDNWGTFQDGYINSLVGQKNVRLSTDGYTYLTNGNDVLLYTGITSVTKDESNIGFVLVNLRNKGATYYSAPGAEEYSAMNSATGAIQEKKYIPTFPLLTNVDGNPTYLLSLKDNAGLVKAYAFVDVADYQKVVVTDVNQGINKALSAYRKMMGNNIQIVGNNKKEGTVTNIKDVVIDGQTYYYFTLENDPNIYKADIKVSDNLPFIITNNIVNIEYLDDLFITNIKVTGNASKPETQE